MRHSYVFTGDDSDTEIKLETDTEDGEDTISVLRAPVPSTRNVDMDRLAGRVAHIQRKNVDETMYQVRLDGVGRSTQHWQEAAEVQRAGGVVFATQQRIKNRRSGKGYAVFFGANPGVYDSWDNAKVQIVGQSNAIVQGYATPEAAQAAFDCAQRHGWTWRTTIPIPHPAPFRLFTKDNLDELEENTLGARYYVVTRGRRPGVYASYLQAAIATTGIPGGQWESFEYVEVALQEYVKAKQAGRVAKIE